MPRQVAHALEQFAKLTIRREMYAVAIRGQRLWSALPRRVRRVRRVQRVRRGWFARAGVRRARLDEHLLPKGCRLARRRLCRSLFGTTLSVESRPRLRRQATHQVAHIRPRKAVGEHEAHQDSRAAQNHLRHPRTLDVPTLLRALSSRQRSSTNRSLSTLSVLTPLVARDLPAVVAAIAAACP